MKLLKYFFFQCIQCFQVICDCGKDAEPLVYPEYVHYILAEEIWYEMISVTQ
jgi:hypothetical protein